jgi:hypothetical protein
LPLEEEAMRYASHPTDDPTTVTAAAPQRSPVVGKPESREWARRDKRAKRSSSSLSVVLSPAGTFVATGTASEQELERGRRLAVSIRQRIETRLLGRVRDLAIQVAGNTVTLEGRCATFYTKQLAQHAALAVLEDEQLVNNIAVAIP